MADTITIGDHVSYLDTDGDRQFGFVLGIRADGTYEVSAGYKGVAHPRRGQVTWEEPPPRARRRR